ncbi:hypothetical protein ACHAWX_002311 [Stephanocyclus meneghinianus]
MCLMIGFDSVEKYDKEGDAWWSKGTNVCNVERDSPTMESTDNKLSPPTTEDPHDLPRTARKRKSTLRARDNAKKGNRDTPWTTTIPTTPAEPPSDHDHDDDDDDDNEEDTLIKERQRDAPIDAPSSHSTSHSSFLAATTDKTSFSTATSATLEPQSSSPPFIARSNNDHRRRRRNLFERALDAGLALCAVSTVLALVLLLDAYEYVIVPKASKPRLASEASAPASRTTAPTPAVTPTNPPASETNDTPSFRKDTKLAEIHARPPSEGIDDALVPSREAFPAKDVLPKEKRAIAQTVETKTDIDPFCPECTWLQTSITCAERFRFIQKRYHTDADDVVKKSLESQGCRRNNEARAPTRDDSYEAVENNAVDEEEDAARASEAEGRATEQVAREEGGIDLFCPECTWHTTSITCAARFKYIQERYHNDEDDVVKKSLLGQGCKRESGARKRLLRGRR